MGCRYLQLEEGVGDLKHEDVRMPVLVHYEDSFDRSPHAEILVVVLQALQSSCNRWILFGLRILRCECEGRHRM